MAELTIERVFNHPVEKVFAFVTKSEFLAQWWGPESMTVPVHQLNFETTGPWHSTMENADGEQFTVSGQVTHVNPPHSVGFTWAWHDDDNKRGADTHVQFTLIAQGDATKFTLHHTELANQDTADRHNAGWNSSLNKLERL